MIHLIWLPVIYFVLLCHIDLRQVLKDLFCQRWYVPLLSAAGTSVVLSFNWYFLPAVRRTAPLLQHNNLMELHTPCSLISSKTTLRAPFTRMQSRVVGWEEVGRVWIYKLYLCSSSFWLCKTSCTANWDFNGLKQFSEVPTACITVRVSFQK